MSEEKVERVDEGGEISHAQGARGECPWCGDELDDAQKCARNCEASRQREDRRG